MTSFAPRHLFASLLLCSSVVAATGCSDLGTHSLAIEGSEQVSAGVTTTDDWTVSFSSLVVVVHNPGLIERTDNEPTWVREFGVSVWDVTQPTEEGETLTSQIRATRYDGADFRIAPASASGYEAVAGNVDADTLDAAVEGDWSVRVVGSATDSTSQTISFDWALTSNRFYRCKLDGDQAVELGADGEETTVIEILGEALFAGEAGPAFGPIAAADADADGEVTVDELDAAGLLAEVEGAAIGAVRGVGPCPLVEE